MDLLICDICKRLQSSLQFIKVILTNTLYSGYGNITPFIASDELFRDFNNLFFQGGNRLLQLVESLVIFTEFYSCKRGETL